MQELKFAGVWAGLSAAGGASLDVEQQLTSDLGAFARLGKSAGNVEAYEFTDIDRAICAGLSLPPGSAFSWAAVTCRTQGRSKS